jgi:F0F1-type ATP synthase assembly protein I
MTPEKRSIASDLLLAIRLAWSFGYIIAIPAVLFGFGGAYLDKALGPSPLFLILGLAIALTLSAFGIYRRVKEIVK